jgi:lysophospholipase L1-like esterase
MSDQNIFSGPPNWCKNAVANTGGWVHPVTGEVLLQVGGNFVTRSEYLALRGVTIPSWITIPANSLNRFKAARNATKAGTADTKVAFIGDSTTRGVVAGVTDGTAYPSSFVAKLPAAVTALDSTLTTFGGGVYGHGGLTPLTTYDNRFAGTFSNGLPTVGGQHLLLNSGSTLNFTPTIPWDSVEITYVRNAGIGTFTVAADGGAVLATVVGNGAAGVLTQVVNVGSVGTHTLNLLGSTNGCYITGFDFYDSTKKQLRLRNLGASSTKVIDANWTGNTNVYDGRPTLRAMANHLVFIQLGINDEVGATSISAYSTALQNLVTDIQTANGDAVLMTPLPISVATTPLATQNTYMQAVRDLATSLGVAMIDLQAYFGSNDRNLAGDRGYFSDDKHPTKTGYVFEAQGIAPLLAA